MFPLYKSHYRVNAVFNCTETKINPNNMLGLQTPWR